MGRQKTMSKEDKRLYCREYYYKTKSERAHEYTLVSRRAYLRRQVKELGDTNPAKVADLQQQIDAINVELEPIRKARWEAKRAAGKALFKHFPDSQKIDEVPTTIE